MNNIDPRHILQFRNGQSVWLITNSGKVLASTIAKDLPIGETLASVYHGGVLQSWTVSHIAANQEGEA